MPPVLTLLPYTTLFRSDRRDRRRGPDQRSHRRPYRAARRADPARDERQDLELARGQLAELPGIDRKSTRLNSSHMSISYAAICVKKKNLQRASHQYSSD